MLPHEQIADALDIAGRIRCWAALVLSSGLPAPACEHLLDIAKRYGMHLLGPNSLGFQRPQLKLNASARVRWRGRARWRWCRNRVR